MPPDADDFELTDLDPADVKPVPDPFDDGDDPAANANDPDATDLEPPEVFYRPELGEAGA